MSDKPEEGDGFEGLETLEKTFQKVLSEIMADKSLDAFRAEYERIYDALVQSHEYNAELVRRVKAMNAEIVANSAKVNSVLKMSQDDQRTIAGLRFEFEKAWKMVELSEEKEGRSKDIVEELKAEEGYDRALGLRDSMLCGCGIPFSSTEQEFLLVHILNLIG